MQTTALTIQPDSSAYPVSKEIVGSIGGFVGAAIVAVMYLRRRLPRDKLEALKDRTEGQFLAQIIAERDKAIADAREAWSQLNAMQRESGRLNSETEYLKRELEGARALVTEIRQGVQQVGRKVDAAENNLKTVEQRNGNSGPAPL